MESEAGTYARELQWLLTQVAVSVKDLSPAQLAWRPETGAANSAYTIAHHVAEATRVYALGFGCGQPVTRDRATEFTAAGTDAGPLVARLEALAADVGATVAALAPADLARRTRPTRELWGTGEIHE